MKNVWIVFVFMGLLVMSQENSHFSDEVLTIQKKYDSLWDSSKETTVFTGSSSIRIWKDLENRFPEHQIINSGFGGSQASDLLIYSNELILNYNPKKVFIYEGDNDIASKKKPKEIMVTINEIIAKIKKHNSEIEIILIAAKPSLARWNLKRTYRRLNRKFKRLSKKDPLIEYADVWKPMLNKRKVKLDIFLKDGLHMNSKGYELWYNALKRYMDANSL